MHKTDHNPNAMYGSPENKEPVSQITSEIYWQFLVILLISENSSSGCLEKKLLVKAKSCLCEEHPFSCTSLSLKPLSFSISNLVPHLKRLGRQNSMQTQWIGSVWDRSSKHIRQLQAS